MGDAGKSIFAIMTAVVGLATVAVLLSRNSATVDVIRESGKAFNDTLKTAVSPITVRQ